MSTAPDTGSLLASFDAEQLGTRLRGLREDRGLTLREVGARLGISASAVSQIERGVLRPSVNRLFELVTAMDATLVDVFGGTSGAPDVELSTPVPDGYVVRRAVEVESVTLEGGVVYRRLSPGVSHDVDFFESTYPPHTVAAGSTSSSRTSGTRSGRSCAVSSPSTSPTSASCCAPATRSPTPAPHRTGSATGPTTSRSRPG